MMQMVEKNGFFVVNLNNFFNITQLIFLNQQYTRTPSLSFSTYF